jgi:predicted nucleotidyltransferase
MRTDINHLPPNKQQELDRVVEMLFQGFLEATQDAKGRRKSARILKIILFGSYARGDWVDAPLDANRYKSDYDILVIVNQKELADRADYWEETEQRLVVAYTVEKAIETLMNFIVHSLQEVNDQLAHGRIFFGEIVKDGALLYESDDRPLATLKPKSLCRLMRPRRTISKIILAMRCATLRSPSLRAKKSFSKCRFCPASSCGTAIPGLAAYAYLLHPHNHNIVFLRDYAEQREPRLFDVWPRGTRTERATYQKLKEAYRKGRYSKHYEISAEEVDWLSERIEILGQRMHAICTEHVARLATAAGLDV